jgi:hypothetical protein
MKSHRLVSSGRLAAFLAGAIAFPASTAAAQDAVADFSAGPVTALSAPSDHREA